MEVRDTPSVENKRDSYFVENPKYPFCKGCGHTSVLRKLNEALVSLQYAPEDISLVTDIGCIGMADAIFKDIHTVHTTHGRSTAFATGISLADSILSDKKLKTVVLIGDGGAMIGLQHLVHAAMLNVDMTVLICNNFVYGMTGGQGSGLTPECFITATTPAGNIVPPVDICQILLSSNAPFVARSIATDQDLSNLIEKAIQYPGFAVIEILELCTEFAVPQNELTGKMLREIAGKNSWQIGVLKGGDTRERFSTRYNEQAKTLQAKRNLQSSPAQSPAGEKKLSKPTSLLLAGSAGEKIQSAGGAICQAAVECGLYATQKNDNPVTQGSGFSLAEIWLSPTEIGYTGIEQPDVLIITSQDGYNELFSKGVFLHLGKDTRVYVDESIELPQSGLTRIQRPFRKIFGPMSASLIAVCMAAIDQNILGEEIVHQILKQRSKGDVDTILHKFKDFLNR